MKKLEGSTCNLLVEKKREGRVGGNLKGLGDERGGGSLTVKSRTAWLKNIAKRRGSSSEDRSREGV